MKKTFAALALATASIASFAAGPTVGLTYDYDRANGNGYKGTHEAHAYIAQETALGTFDIGLLADRFRGPLSSDNANGYELGYSNGLSFGQIGVKGRVGFGRLNAVDPNGGGFTGSASYYTAAVEGAMPVTTAVNGFVGYEHKGHVGTDNFQAENRYTAGVDYALNKEIALRVGYAHTRQGGLIYNGVTTGVSYSF